MNSNENPPSKKTIHILEIILEYINIDFVIGWILSKFLDRLLLIPHKLLNSIRDLYHWRKTNICQNLDYCEKFGEYVNGQLVLGADSLGRNTCGGCFERFAIPDNKNNLKEAIKFEAELSGDEISNEDLDICAEEIIKNRKKFYLIKKLKFPILLINKILHIIKWKWGKVIKKHFVMGCKFCGATWISDLDLNYEECPNCDSSNNTYPIQPGKIDLNHRTLNEICTNEQIALSKVDNSLNRTWSKSVEDKTGCWNVLISALLNPNKKDIKFLYGNISLNGDVTNTRFFLSKNDVTLFIDEFKANHTIKQEQICI